MAATASERFYAELPVIADLDEVMKPENYRALPGDWSVALCDVRNSTGAIQRGQYRSVNSLGAAAISAILNAAGELEVPFSFEGDGCVACVPPALLAPARAALARAREIARDAFDLELRAATVPAALLRDAGHPVFVARYRVSDNYVQALFAGGGVAHADRLIKDPVSGPGLMVDDSVEPMADMKGFECRWEDIPSRYGETVCVMVRVLESDPGRAVGRYREVVAKVREIYGDDEMSHPLAVPDLHLSLNAKRLGVEAAIRAATASALGKWLWIQGARAAVLAGKAAMRYGLHGRGTDWGRYKEAVVRNADVRKFIDLYRHIVAGTPAQRAAFSSWLEERYLRGELVYGLHVSDRAHMTCLVFDYSGRHLHFVDGADGGFFLAATDFKKRVACLAEKRAAA